MSGIIEFFLLLVFGFFSNGDNSISKLEEVNIQLTANPSGKTYEDEVVSILSRDTSIKRECAIPSQSRDEKLIIFLVITTKGNVEQVYVDPVNEVTECISESLKSKVFPAPLTDFVAKIEY